ncbi:MAG: peptidoglycan-binding protein [Clostridiales bacterium]|jgi:peptidoglycan hydrolase-like protein with peptidoglycan-binding domain|nr:peptidoglycan-binding protein [Clostridiales bacterium]
MKKGTLVTIIAVFVGLVGFIAAVMDIIDRFSNTPDNAVVQSNSSATQHEPDVSIAVMTTNLPAVTAPELDRYPLYPGAPLARGSASNNIDDVMLIQEALNQVGTIYSEINTLTVDGGFGPMTEGAIIAFQRIMGIEANGVVDSTTWYSIMGAAENYIPPQPMQPISQPPLEQQPVSQSTPPPQAAAQPTQQPTPPPQATVAPPPTLPPSPPPTNTSPPVPVTVTNEVSQGAAEIFIGGSANGRLDNVIRNAWHYIEVPHNGVLTVDFRQDSTLRTSVSLFASNASSSIQNANNQGFSTAAQSGRYYIRVSRSSGDGSYTLSASFVAQTSPNLRQSNDGSSQSANHSYIGMNNEGHLGYRTASNGAVDANAWYYIDVSSNGVLTIDFAQDSTLRTTVYLYASNASSSMNNASNQGFSTPVQPGRYFIRLNHRSGYGAYTMSTSFVAQTAANFRQSNDNSSQNANYTQLYTTNYGHLGYRAAIDGSTDTEAWYAIDIHSAGSLTIDFVQDSTLRTSVFLYDSNASRAIASQSNRGFSSNVQPGRYYIRISRSSGYGAFSFSVALN